MWDFLKENWISITALTIALSGGIPGIISIVNYFHNRPIFGFEPHGILTGTLASDNSERNILMLFGTVTNAGTKPLNPKSFGLKVQAGDKWVSLRKMAIPETCVFNSERQKIKIKEPSKINLQEWKRPILIGEPARGCLLFESNELVNETLTDNNSMTFELICVDIFNKEYTFTTTYGPFADFKENIKLLKYDVTFGPKN